MIICQKCNTKNELGIIHCVQCSTRLELPNNKADVTKLASQENFSKHGKFHIFKQSLKAIIITLAIIFPILLLFPSLQMPALSEDEVKNVESRYNKQTYLNGISEEYTIQELSHILNKEFQTLQTVQKNQWYSIVPKQLSITYKNKNTLCLTVHTRFLANIIPVSVNYFISYSPENNTFKLDETSIGKIPVKTSHLEILSTNLANVWLNSVKLQTINSKLQKLSYLDNKFIITTK